MQRSAPGFEASYRRHLATEQRRAVLDALSRAFAPEATVGEIVDAAAALGWTDLGELSLADLADALLVELSGAATATDAPKPAEVDEDEEEANDDDDGSADADEDDGEEEAEEVVAEPPRGNRRSVAAPPAANPGKAAKPAATKPAAKPAAPAKPAKGAKPGKPTKVSLDDRMSLDEAAAVLLPLVRQHGEATMQQLEQSTAGAGRRKLRFHIGQLVKNGRLERHGMGRGTFYTVA